MKLYDSRRAPNPRRVRWFMAEKGIEDIEIVDVDLFKGEHRSPDYLARAGIANVPALEVDDELTITESVAICRYLESLYPEPNMLGRDPREIAVIEMWSRRVELMVAQPLMMAVRHAHPALAALEKQVPQIAEANRGWAERSMKMLNRQLSKSAFIAGEHLTMADILAATSIDFARMVQFKPGEEFEHVHRWLGAMMARPAATAGT
ncbi:MAG: glutathione S-transferase family protein [Caulobacter sp.]